jgi:hypothetical protein
MMKQNLIQKTMMTLCLMAIASFSACTQTTPAQPTYAAHLYTKSDAKGSVEIVSGAPTDADANLEMTNAKKVTHTFSDGSSVTWNIENNGIFFDGVDLDYGVTSADKMFNAVLDGEVRLNKIHSRAVLADGQCAGFSIGVLCIKRDVTLAPNQTFNFTFDQPTVLTKYGIGVAASEDTKMAVRAAVKIWNDKFAASSIHTKLKWVELPNYVAGSGMVRIFEVNDPLHCGVTNHVGYGSFNTIAISTITSWGVRGKICPASKLRTVLHEMGHKMGLFHEHSRCDRSTKGPLEFYFFSNFSQRDSYAAGPKITAADEEKFLENNCGVIGGLSDDVEAILPGSTYDITPYDVGSIMHYPTTHNLISKNSDQRPPGYIGISFRFKFLEGQTTPSDNQTSQLMLIGRNEEPSTYDMFAIADLYRCPLTKPECK